MAVNSSTDIGVCLVHSSIFVQVPVSRNSLTIFAIVPPTPEILLKRQADHGIPSYLAAKAVGETVISLACVEVGEGESEPPAYARRFNHDTLPFDYVWFTPRLDDQDPCEKFKTELEQLRKAK